MFFPHLQIDEILERSDRNYFSKKEFKEKIAQLTELAVQQQQRLKKAKECLEKEQEICQKDYDEMFDKAEQLNATFQQLKQLNVRRHTLNLIPRTTSKRF